MPVAKQLLARIELVETVFLRLIDRLGFDVVQKRVLSAAPVDGMLDLAFLTQNLTPKRTQEPHSYRPRLKLLN